MSIKTRAPPARIDTADLTLNELPSEGQKQAEILRTIGVDFHKHHLTKYGLKDLHMAQSRDVHLLAIRKLMKKESLEDPGFPDEVQAFAKRYYNQKEDLLFLNTDDILCVNYVPQQRALHVRPCMIVMPQLFQHEILYRAHDESGHQGVGKVLARIQERHTWPVIRRDVVNHIKRCLTCQQAKHPGRNPFYPLQNINSSNFNDLVQFDHRKLCKTVSGNTGMLVIIDHFTKFAEAIPCAHDEYDAQTTAKIILNKWFARHGTPARMQSDNATNFTTEVAQELMKASQVTKVTSKPEHPRGNDKTELYLPCLESTRHAECKTGMNTLMEYWVPTTQLGTPRQDFRHICFTTAPRNPFHCHSYTRKSQREDLTQRKNLWNTYSLDNKKFTSWSEETPIKPNSDKS